MLRFHAFQGQSAAPATLPPAGFEVGPATDEEVAALLAVVERDRPRPYREALDLVPERVRMDALRREWAEAGLRRERALMAARRDGEAVAVALFEMASDGIHLYGLLDAVRLFPLVEGGEAGFGALVEAARGWFREHGKEHFIYLQEYGDPADLAAAGLIDLGATDYAIFASGLLPDFMEHIWEVTVGVGDD